MKEIWLLFVVMTIVCWGCYVPTLHEGQKLLGGKPSEGGLRAFLCVGVAYFFTAVVIPALLLFRGMEPTSFNAPGTTFATFSGVLGALGALGIILSIKNGGSPMVIPSLVFAGAPIVNVLVNMAWHKPSSAPHPLFFVGIVLAAVGAGMVLWYRPTEAKPKPTAAINAPAAPSASNPF